MKPSNKLLYKYFEEYVEQNENDIFLFDEENRYTTKQAFEIARSLAFQLESNGIKCGDLVSVKGNRTLRTVLIFYAVEFMGAVAIMYDPREIMEGKNRISDSVLYVGEREVPLSFDVREYEVPELARDSKATGAIIFTSGSTGEKKAVCLSQYNFINNSLDTLNIGGYREDDINILIVPVHHVFGLALIVTAVVAKHSVFVPRSVERDYIIDCMIKYEVTRLNGVPSLYLALASSPHAGEMKHLRCGLIGGAPYSEEQFSWIEDRLGITLVPVYGMSECIGISCGDYRAPVKKRCDNVGKVYSMNEVKIRKDGEICVRSPAVMLGYYKDEVATESAIGDGWLHTGDLGYLDEEGYLRISGRKKDIIIRNGNNISAAKIENALLGISYVDSAAVVAGRDEAFGEVPCALIVLKRGETRTQTEILHDLQGALTKIEMPAKIKLAEELPLTSTGKTDKEKVKTLFAETDEKRKS